MMWQDLVFLAGSVLSIVFLAPTVRDSAARIPLGSSVPSMTIGAVYSFTYATMGMTFSALGAAGVAIMWSLIVCYRAPCAGTGPTNIVRFLVESIGRGRQFVTGARGDEHVSSATEQVAD
ncbi:hypothetical protein [Natronorubrum texcoconense]|uniref:Uncharacterized protein n=1 Tax=Natronorubrum texcoconense TaxID=1095776 RepID=A0A1G9GYT7_9EURY|nr:hypothetical protein [Natronorubrum texcoconense]SDL05819.1 hypothetical protein SAMN04515672_0068 [Natronorubrum texcoconense]